MSKIAHPDPHVDTEGMHLYAAVLKSAAETIRAAGTAAADSVDAATFKGPAGDATRLRASHLRTRTARRAAELQAMANDITRKANNIDDAPNEWRHHR
jgi:hypothetical protein